MRRQAAGTANRTVPTSAVNWPWPAASLVLAQALAQVQAVVVEEAVVQLLLPLLQQLQQPVPPSMQLEHTY